MALLAKFSIKEQYFLHFLQHVYIFVKINYFIHFQILILNVWVEKLFNKIYV